MAYTRWFKYDRDICGLFTQSSVSIIFEPPCIYWIVVSKECGNYLKILLCLFKLLTRQVIVVCWWTSWVMLSVWNIWWVANNCTLITGLKQLQLRRQMLQY